MEQFKDFIPNEKAEKDPLDGVVTIAIALILIATLGVAAWNLLGNANYSFNSSTGVGFDPTTKTLVQTVVGVIAAITIVVILVGVAKKYKM